MAWLRSPTQLLGKQSANPEAISWIGRAALLGAAALFGFGVLLWIAANWDDFGRFGRFGLAGGVIAASSIAAALKPSLRVPGCLIAMLGTGGLLVLIGQTYQSGADPWQLFALWAVLTLPLALAARHDVVWVPWTIVTFTAIPLWGFAQTGFTWQRSPSVVYAMWLAAIGISVLLSPRTGLTRWIGDTKWSFRLAVFSTLGLIASVAVPAVFASRTPETAIFWAGLALTVLMALAFTRTKPLEIGLLAATGLTIDVLLIAGFVRLVFSGHRGEQIGASLMTGLMAAGTVAVTAVALLKLIKSQAVTSGATSGAANFRHAPDRTWPVTVLSGIGALLAATPLVSFYFLSFGVFLQHGPGPYLLGLATLAGALALLRSAVPLGFGQQFGVIALAVGFIVAGFGLYRDLAPMNASVVMALLAGATAIATPTGWIRSLLGAAAAAFTAAFMAEALAPVRTSIDLAGFRIAWTLIAGAGAGVLWLLTHAGNDAGQPRPHDARPTLSTPFLSGWIAAGLIGLMLAAGPTFLLGAGFGIGGSRLGTPTGLVQLWTLNGILSVVAAIAACALLSTSRPETRTPIGAALGLVLIVLSAFAPGFGVALVVLAVCLGAQRLPLAAFATFAGLWIMGSFYYWLGWPLIQKAYLLMALGGGLAAVCFLSHIRWPSLSYASAADRALPAAIAAVLIGVSAVATAGIASTTIVQKEAVIRNGRQIYIALAPVDPRSLMQGDYMALRFALPNATANTRNTAGDPQPSGTPKAIATVDARGVATVSSISWRDPAPAADQVRIQLKQKNGRWIIATDAWFFKEGTGERYAKARFGEFRIDSSGHAILVGLADAELKRL